MTITGLSLGAEFGAADHADWLKLIEKTLKGKSVDDKLLSRTRDGLRVEPL